MVFNLNEEQENVVTYSGDKFLSVEAGPGAGKTRVIIERVKYLLNELKVDPSSLLIITFTKKAAEELQDRLIADNIPKNDIKNMQISTIHSFCTKILEKNGAVGFSIIGDDLDEKINMYISGYLDELGFINEYYIPPSQIKDIIRKYDEYCMFKVNTPKLIKYIEETRPIDEEYVDFVRAYMEANDGKFPRRKVSENELYKKSWYNAKYLQIAKSYPIYLDILERENVTDFGHMQVKTLELLQKNPITPYKNILIDEFQDTDPVQMKIFEILMENADSFTVVGDINQSIYGFRGSSENYFDYLADNYANNLEAKSLPTNYRSTHEIIDISEDYIAHQRSANSKLGKAKCGRDINNEVYYLISEDKNDEAENIFNVIKDLKEKGKIRKYSDIGILTRSVKGSSSCIDALLNLLEENNIPYQIKGRNDLLDKDEIKSVLTLLYHLIEDEDPHNYIMNRWQKDWLNLKAYTGSNFNQMLFDLSDDTKRILNNIQDDFEANVLALEKEVYQEFMGKKSRIKKFVGVFNRDEEILDEIFKKVQKPILTNQNLVRWGITNEDDLAFFQRLNALKESVSDRIEYFKRPTLLEVYISLLTDVCHYLNKDMVLNNEEYVVENLSNMTNTLFNFEVIRGDRNLRGAFWFIYRNIEGHASFLPDNEGVQIMTVHKSKGLEFPVVILASLDDNRFPMKFKDPNPESGYRAGSPIYYTPLDCLENRQFSSEEEELRQHNYEEERVIYVAMTRAEDTLILSSIVKGSDEYLHKALENSEDIEFLKNIPKGPASVQKAIDSNLDYCKLIDPNNIDISVLEREYGDENDSELVNLSYTAIENYLNCPFKYKMANDLNFKTSESKYVDDGIFIHAALEVINKKIKANDNLFIGTDEIKKVVSGLFKKSNASLLIEKPEQYESKLAKITEDVIYYYENYGLELEILDSEYPFFIKNENYSFSGFVDLIYRKENGKIGILDYKNTSIEGKFEDKYKKQLHMYAHALRDKHQKYENCPIKELEVYAIKSKRVISFDIDEEEIEKSISDLDYVADNIRNENYPATPNDECDNCSYSKICGRNNQIKL